MKNWLLLLISFFTLSCEVGDNSIQDYQEFLPVISAEIPNEIRINNTYNINVIYNKKSSCHVYNDMLYSKESQSNTIAIVATNVQSNGNCTIINEEKEASFRFEPTETGDFTLKFWQGKNESNENIYLSYTISITE